MKNLKFFLTLMLVLFLVPITVNAENSSCEESAITVTQIDEENCVMVITNGEIKTAWKPDDLSGLNGDNVSNIVVDKPIVAQNIHRHFGDLPVLKNVIGITEESVEPENFLYVKNLNIFVENPFEEQRKSIDVLSDADPAMIMETDSSGVSKFVVNEQKLPEGMDVTSVFTAKNNVSVNGNAKDMKSSVQTLAYSVVIDDSGNVNNFENDSGSQLLGQSIITLQQKENR